MSEGMLDVVLIEEFLQFSTRNPSFHIGVTSEVLSSDENIGNSALS